MPSDHEKMDKEPVGEFLWRGVCRRMGIKDSLSEQASLCEYTWEVIACMVMTGKGRSGPDIWSETPNQDTGTKEMILTTWYKEAMKQSGINLLQHHSLIPSAKKARHASYISSNYKNSYAHLIIDT